MLRCKSFMLLALLFALTGSAVMVPLARADRIPSPGDGTAVCEAFGTVTYYETFRGGRLARVAIVGDGATDLDIFVYDMQGRRVAQGIGPTDIEVVTWLPSEPQTYRIVVRNLGATWNRFSMATN
jgi:hypothetical protein